MIASVIDVREWQRLEKGSELAFDEPLASFERLLADLSATFINVPSGQVDGVIQDAQRRIIEALDLDRTILWIAQDGDLFCTHDWTRPWFRTRTWFPTPARISARELLPWSLEKTNAGELVQFSSVDHVPNEVESSELPAVRYEIGRTSFPSGSGAEAWAFWHSPPSRRSGHGRQPP